MSSLLKASRGLLAYTVWANRLHVGAVAHVDPEDLTRETGSSFGSVLGTMGHILACERIWLGRFLGNPLEPAPGPDSYPDFEILKAACEEHSSELEFFLASLSEEQLEGVVNWVARNGEARSQPLWQPLLHMVNHSTYHRGQVTTLLRQLGYQPPASDLTAYFAHH